MSQYQDILDKLPYSEPFLFVDELIDIDENGASGSYTFKKDESFYAGHFTNEPITPGVILVECMAQIGLVSLGIFLLNSNASPLPKFAFTSADVDFLKAVYPGEKVFVKSIKKYFRFGKLKCEVEMTDTNDTPVCRGELSGMIIK